MIEKDKLIELAERYESRAILAAKHALAPTFSEFARKDATTEAFQCFSIAASLRARTS